MKSYTIRFVMVKKELEVLKKALTSYTEHKDICKDLLRLINYQENEANKE